MRDERGLTLIELLTAVAITSVISVVIASAMVTGLRTTDDTHGRVQETQDSQIVAAAFTADVQSASSVSLTNATCAGGQPLVHLAWTDAGSNIAVAYRARSTDGGRVLSRYRCVDGGAAARRDVGFALHPSTDPVIECSPGGCPADARTLSLTVTEDSGWSFTVSASRRRA